MTSSPSFGLLLDTVIFNRLLDRKLEPSVFGDVQLYATHLQGDELNETPDPLRRGSLLSTFKQVAPAPIATESFILGLSRLDNAKLASSDTLYHSILKEIGEKPKNPNNPRRDALIGETAIRNGLTLITDDQSLRDAVNKLGGMALTLAEFEKNAAKVIRFDQQIERDAADGGSNQLPHDALRQHDGRKTKRTAMTSITIRSHYAPTDVSARILAALKAAGKDLAHLTPDDLAPMDEFHTRGRAATVDLARLLALTGKERVIDVGCGIGGPSRYLAHTFGCRVTGIDLTPEFVQAATMLAEMTGLKDRVDYKEANALALPFPDESFDIAWSQNAVMNIEDRDRLYAEIRRVLKPGGRYAFSDIVAGENAPPLFPVPWASDPATSFLLSADATKSALARAGFRIAVFEDQTADAIAGSRNRYAGDTLPPLGIHVLLGENFPQMGRNMMRNFEEGRIRLAQGVAALP